ncbi:MAG: LemA family protein [Actinomycetota bacterium]|nr:LemA family protein [Actinomycetota bacterium]
MSKKLLFGCLFGFIGVIIIVGLILFGYVVDARNNMAAQEIEVENSWAQVQNVYQRRLDLIPNVVASVEAYMQLEKDIFKEIADARKGITEAQSPQQLENANEPINSFLRDLRVVVEDTPELKSSETVRELIVELEGSENRIAQERRRFNETVRDYNTYIKMFPRNMIAGWFNFTPKSFFEAEEGAEQAPEVNIELD